MQRKHPIRQLWNIFVFAFRRFLLDELFFQVFPFKSRLFPLNLATLEILVFQSIRRKWDAGIKIFAICKKAVHENLWF